MDKSSCATPVNKIRVGVSACLLGAKVRFDGGHKRNRYVDEVLRDYFEFVPLCPEVAVGLGTPRQPIRLLGTADSPRVVGTREPQIDVTDALSGYGRSVAQQHGDLCGMIVKQGSPDALLFDRYGDTLINLPNGEVRRPNLEDLFLDLTGHSLRA